MSKKAGAEENWPQTKVKLRILARTCVIAIASQGVLLSHALKWVFHLIENYQQADGTVVIPEALRPYLNAERITPAGHLG